MVITVSGTKMVDLSFDIEEGKYHLFDVYKKHGPFFFQLLANAVCATLLMLSVGSWILGTTHSSHLRRSMGAAMLGWRIPFPLEV